MSKAGEPAPGRSIQAPPHRRYPGRIIGPQRAHRHDPTIAQRLLRCLGADGGHHTNLLGSQHVRRPPGRNVRGLSASLLPAAEWLGFNGQKFAAAGMERVEALVP
jgi:hypothetical protein